MIAGKLIGVSFDITASPGLAVKPLRHAGSPPASWGLAWCRDDDAAAISIKDPADRREDPATETLDRWERFRTTAFVLHTRTMSTGTAQQDTQPFARSYSRQDVVFAHSGDLAEEHRHSLHLATDPTYEPLGRTDSEYAFCWLLERLKSDGARSIADAGWLQWLHWLRQMNVGGVANVLMTDGRDMIAYRDASGVGSLSVVRRVPPNTEPRIENREACLDVGDPHTRIRTHVIFATDPLDGSNWSELEPGQLLVARLGQIVWNSLAVTGRSGQMVTVTAPPRASGADGAASAVPEPTTAPAVIPPASRDLTVTHETVYLYESPVESSTHLLRLRPVWDAHQQLLDYELNVTPEVHQRTFEDVFGNHVVQFRIDAPYTELRVRMRSTVRLDLRNGAELPHDRITIPLLWMPWQRQLMHAYLLPPELPETQLQELSEFAMSFVERQDHDLLWVLRDINSTIHRDFQYVSGSTTLETTPFDVYANRRGVCQDFANLFICLARLLNVPARYRVGYIYTGANALNTMQSDASHAWAEVYLPSVGWLGFDPTNGCQVGPDHIRVASGRNYRDATPTSGTIFRGGWAETLRVVVNVDEAPSPGEVTGPLHGDPRPA